jgi:hypothetical protein
MEESWRQTVALPLLLSRLDFLTNGFHCAVHPLSRIGSDQGVLILDPATPPKYDVLVRDRRMLLSSRQKGCIFQVLELAFVVCNRTKKTRRHVRGVEVVEHGKSQSDLGERIVEQLVVKGAGSGACQFP